MGRSASLFGLLGLVFLAFGISSTLFVPLDDLYVVLNLGLGAVLLLTYVAFGFESFRGLFGQRATRYGAGAALYSALFIALIAGLNYLGARYHHRWDVTEAGVYTLAPQSRQVVTELDGELSMTAFVEAGIDPTLQTLLESYAYVAPASVRTKLLDPDREPALTDQMKITTVPSVHLRYGDESFVVTQPTEETITNGIIRVSQAGKKVAYFAEGFGSLGIDNPQDPKGYSQAKLALEQENYEVQTFLWPSIAAVPDDASVVIVAGIGQPPTDHAMTVLEDYLRRGGRVLLLVAPEQADQRLVELLARWGVTLGDDIVIDEEMRLFQGPTLGVQPISNTYGEHPITANFRDYSVFPQTRTVEEIADVTGITATSLVKTGPTSWAEADVAAVFDQGVANLDPDDRRGPVSIAVAAEATLAEMADAPPEGAAEQARLVVVGTPYFADNQLFGRGGPNADLFLNSVGWLVGQEELVSVRSRTVRASRAELTGQQASRVFYLSVLIVPEALVLLGIGVWWRRRSR